MGHGIRCPLRRRDHLGGLTLADETERLLYEILQYVRASAVATVRGAAKTVIDSSRKAKVYAAMTGEKSIPEIASSTGIPRATVWRYQVDFISAGLATPSGKHHRNPCSLFSLEELGLAGLASTPAEATAEKAEGTDGVTS